MVDLECFVYVAAEMLKSFGCRYAGATAVRADREKILTDWVPKSTRRFRSW